MDGAEFKEFYEKVCDLQMNLPPKIYYGHRSYTDPTGFLIVINRDTSSFTKDIKIACERLSFWDTYWNIVDHPKKIHHVVLYKYVMDILT